MQAGTNVFRFPTRLRVVPIEPATPVSEPESGVQLVDHGGRFYAFRNLLARLPTPLREVVSDEAPRIGQETWDLIVRRWPQVAECLIADTHAEPWQVGWSERSQAMQSLVAGRCRATSSARVACRLCMTHLHLW